MKFQTSANGGFEVIRIFQSVPPGCYFILSQQIHHNVVKLEMSPPDYQERYVELVVIEIIRGLESKKV